MTAQEEFLLLIRLRESRLVLERILQVQGVDPGLIYHARDCIVLSQAMGLGGFAMLRDLLHQQDWPHSKPLVFSENDSDILIDCGGQHAWLIASLVIDVLVDLARRFGTARVELINVSAASELPILDALAEPYRVQIAVFEGTEERNTVVQIAAERRAEIAQKRLEGIRVNGLPVSTDLWWHLYEFSKNALEPDTAISRRHTGAVVTTEDDSAFKQAQG